MRKLLIIVVVAATQLLGACSGARIPFVHRIDIQQGNVVTQDMLDKLEPGMEQDKVRYVMGTPLIMDAFHPERWDYLYSYQAGDSKEREQRQISLYFDKGRLARIEGDVKPSADDKALAGSTGPKTVDVPPKDGDGGFLQELMKRFHLGEAEAGPKEPSEGKGEGTAQESGKAAAKQEQKP